MTGFELLKLLTEQSHETLHQEVLFEFEVQARPDLVYSSQVPITQTYIADADRLYVPDHGLITPEQAMESYNQMKAEAAAGECTMEEIEQYMPFNCPQILTKGQLLMKLQPTKAYNDPEHEQRQVSDQPPKMAVSHWGTRGEA